MGSGANANEGEREWIYVFNDEAATNFAEGHVVSRDAATIAVDGILAPANTHACRVVGVVQHAIAFGSFGFILRKGIGEVLADAGGVTADLGLIVGDAAGTADAAAAVTDASFGVAIDTAASALATCWVNCQG